MTSKVKINHPPPKKKNKQKKQKNNRDLNQCLLHLWSKFGDLAWTGPELSRGQARDWHTNGHTHTHGHTHKGVGDDNTRRPKLASGKKANVIHIWLIHSVCILLEYSRKHEVGKIIKVTSLATEIHVDQWDVIIHPWLKGNVGLVTLKLDQTWII